MCRVCVSAVMLLDYLCSQVDYRERDADKMSVFSFVYRSVKGVSIWETLATSQSVAISKFSVAVPNAVIVHATSYKVF